MALFLLLRQVQVILAACPEDCLGRPCLDSCYSDCQISCESSCASGCLYRMISDSICQAECQVPSCFFDEEDCRKRVLYTTVNITNSSLIEENSKVKTKNYGKVAGVGLGVFLTIMMMILGVILCIIGTATPVFFVFLLLGILIPLITFLIVAFAPLHKDQKEKADTRTDDFFAARVIFLLFISLCALLAIVKLFEYYVGINLKAKGVNSNTSAISSADLIAPDGDPQANPGNPLNPLAGPQNANPLVDANNPLVDANNPLARGNQLVDRNNPLAGNPFVAGNSLPAERNPFLNQPNPLAPGSDRQAANPLLGNQRDNPPFNPLVGAGPAEHPLAPLK